MEIQEIEVIINRNGELQILVRGVKGGKCLELTRGLESVLGGELLSRDLTSEAYEPSTQPVATQIEQGASWQPEDGT